uniref:Complex 1 LYR protein domain-containing protein n=1 Tax=Amblyomma cajennense TaxID=34607 RepID=A0A023FGT0_AMBCJ
MFSATMFRRDVLRLYKQLLRTGRTWAAETPEKTQEEQFYIISETKDIFRRNKHIQDSEAIKECLREGQSRLDLALHYHNPYPRPVNLAPSALSPSHAKHLKVQRKLWKASRPIYIRSIDAESSPPDKN